MKRPTASNFMRAELEEYEKNRIQSLHIERANLFLAGKYELEEGEILVGLKHANSNDIITFTSDKWEGELVYDPGYEFSCDYCGTEMEDAVGGYWKDDIRYCAHCAWDLFDQPNPITNYEIWRQEKDEEAERKKKSALLNNILAKQESAKLQERERMREQELMEESDYVDRALSREYYHEQDVQLDCDIQLPNNLEELYEYLDEQFKIQEVESIVTASLF